MPLMADALRKKEGARLGSSLIPEPAGHVQTPSPPAGRSGYMRNPLPIGPANIMIPGSQLGSMVGSQLTPEPARPAMGPQPSMPPPSGPQSSVDLMRPAPPAPPNYTGGNPFAQKAQKMGFSDFQGTPRANIMNAQASALRGGENG